MSNYILTCDSSDLEQDRQSYEADAEALVEAIPELSSARYVDAVEALAAWLGVGDSDRFEFFGTTPWTDGVYDLVAKWGVGDPARTLKELNSLAEEVVGWHSGVTLIREDTFEAYAEQHANDLGLTTDGWPYDHIDWADAAETLRADYEEVDYDGHTWLYR